MVGAGQRVGGRGRGRAPQLEQVVGVVQQLPLGLTSRQARRGDAQTAYRVLVALHSDGLDDDRLLWDSGRVEGDDSLHVEYDGSPLQSSTRYYWRVAVWDADG